MPETDMQQDPDRQQTSRENTLTIALVLLVGGMMLFFLYLISLGIVGNVIAGGVVFVVIGALHYLVWGRAFSQEVEAEREMFKRQDKPAVSKTKPAPVPQAPVAILVEEKSAAIQDIGRTHSVEKHEEK
jgi:hypothetical protein